MIFNFDSDHHVHHQHVYVSVFGRHVIDVVTRN